MKAFQTALVHDLDEAGFADMYAQTIAYGLLSARITDPAQCTADDFAAHMRTNPFLRKLMETFLRVGGRRGKAGGPGIDFDELGVSEVVELLDQANMEAVVRDFGDRNPQEDPVIHFYEHFLAAYDKRQKVSQGRLLHPARLWSPTSCARWTSCCARNSGSPPALPTPRPGVIWRSATRNSKIPEGTSPAQAFVQILDPATGTGTFLVEVIDLIHRTMAGEVDSRRATARKRFEALWNDYVPERTCCHACMATSCLMAPYAIAHLKIGLKLYRDGLPLRERRARPRVPNERARAAG